MSLGGITDYLRANNISAPEDYSSIPYLPYAQQGPYDDIMARMRASGGRGGFSGVYGGGGTTGGAGSGGAMGGYDPNLYKRAATAGGAPTDSYMYGGGSSLGGGGGGGLSYEQRMERSDPTAWSNLNDAQKANFYANNPAYGTVTGLLQSGFGFTSPGMLQNFLVPDFVKNQQLIARGINPTATSEINTGNTVQDPMQAAFAAQQGGFAPVAAPEAAPVAVERTLEQQIQDNAARIDQTIQGYADRDQMARIAEFDASREGLRGGAGGYGGGGVATGGYGGDASGGGDRGTRGGFAKGGPVSMNRLQGPNPMGPDDGYAAMKYGEFVINNKAVAKYGIDLMNAINSGKINKGKLRGLLEM